MTVGDLQWVMARERRPEFSFHRFVVLVQPHSPGTGRDGEGRHLPALQLQAVPKAAADLHAL